MHSTTLIATIAGLITQRFATLVTMLIFSLFGFDPKTGMVIGMAMAVASTVVLMRVLMDADVLSSTQGISRWPC